MATSFKKSIEVLRMENQWRVMTDVYHGNTNIKSQNKYQDYLMQFAKESNSVYEERKKFSIFHNFTKNEIDEVGQTPFRSNLIYNQNFNKEYKEILMENADLKFTSYKDFLEECNKFSVLYGVHAVFTDYFGKRPFFESVKAPQILGAWGEYSPEGEYQLKCFIFYKDFIRYNNLKDKTHTDHTETVIRRVIKLTHPNRVEVYEANVFSTDSTYLSVSSANNVNTNGSDSKYNPYVFDYQFDDALKFRKISDKKIDSEKIPVELLFSDTRQGTISCIVPYYDIARMNIVHYNKTSSRDNILRISGYPILKATGVPQGLDRRDNFDGTFSPNKAILLESDQADVNFIEPEGSSIQQIREDIKELEVLILQKSYEWINSNKNNVTATGSRIDESNKISHIKTITKRVEEFSNKCLKHFADYASLSEEDKNNFNLNISTDFEYLSPDTKINNLMKGYEVKLLSDKVVTDEFKRFEILPDNFNIDENNERVEEIREKEQERMQNQMMMEQKIGQQNENKPTKEIKKPRGQNSEGGSNAKSKKNI